MRATGYKENLNRLFLIAILVAPKFACAQLELYTKINSNGTFAPVINYNGNKTINKKLSVTFFGLIRENWGQALIGLAYSPSDIVTISASAGIEHGKNVPRYSASIFTQRGKNRLLLLGELGAGKDNYLYKINAFHRFDQRIELGLSAWRYHGIGPDFKYTIPRLSSTLWIMPSYDFEEETQRIILGISLAM